MSEREHLRPLDPRLQRHIYSGVEHRSLGHVDGPATEQDDLARGFAECWRVLAPGGTLVFKWGAGGIERVEPHFPAEPIVGTRSPRGGQTRWFIFYKPLNEEVVARAVA